MAFWSIFRKSFANFMSKPMFIVSLVAVSFIPILYSGFLIKGTWDPYGQLNELPVAIVNLDRGAVSEGEAKNIGNDFVNELKKNESFDWHFVNEEEARQGMLGNRYYAQITIPADFSEKAVSLAGDKPRQAELVFESNSYYNFVAGQISENATKELKEKLSHSLTEAYSRGIFGKLETLASGIRDASEGARKLRDGALDLNNGASKLNGGLATLSEGANKLNGGAGSLVSGAKKLADGAKEASKGATDLTSGARKLADAGGKLVAGAKKAEQGSSTLAAGMKSSKQGADELTAGLTATVDGSKSLRDGLAQSADGSDGVAAGSVKVAEGLKKAMAANDALASDPQLKELLAASEATADAAKKVAAANKSLLAGSKSLVSGQQKLLDGSRVLSAGQSKLLQGATDLQAGQRQLSDGLSQVNTGLNVLADGGSRLSSGTNALSSGANSLLSGAEQAAKAIGSVDSGAATLHAGAGTLANGASSLSSGAGELATKLGEAADATSKIRADDELIRLLAQPVAIRPNEERKVTVYGAGIAPYFISMALFAGALVFTTIVSARRTLSDDVKGVPVFLTKLILFGGVSLAQSLIVVTILVFALGLETQSIPLFYLYTVIVGLTFMFIIQAFVTWLDLPGRFVVLLLMIFQLASSAGTFPLELLPGWAKAMNPWLPMTYSIRGFRDVISSGDYDDMWKQVTRLALYMIAFLILTLVYFLIPRKDKEEEQLLPVNV
ncbi:YhgE/Pip family protein [Cohnella soli]|uniref:YhgE/Pip family protein n=1 Tax=Cohnella soli TaxID=425005 RepID=A0ABW0I0L1_9BACL